MTSILFYIAKTIEASGFLILGYSLVMSMFFDDTIVDTKTLLTGIIVFLVGFLLEKFFIKK